MSIRALLVRAAVAGALAVGAAACGQGQQNAAPPPPPPPLQADKKPAPAPAAAAAPAEAAAASHTPDPANGQQLYVANCASCHGATGAGDGPAAAAMDPKPAKHSDAAYMSTRTDEQVFQAIKEGGASVGKSPMMAPYGGALSDAQIHDLVAFIRTLAK
jgi:mono/diheme cytochrome c family protein